MVFEIFKPEFFVRDNFELWIKIWIKNFNVNKNKFYKFLGNNLFVWFLKKWGLNMFFGLKKREKIYFEAGLI